LLRLTALALAALQAYAGRHYLNADGVSYLDLADAWAHGNWQGGISTYWGPLYPGLLAAALALFRPTAYWEFALVKLVGLGLFAAALFAFEWLLREQISLRRSQGVAEDGLTERAFVLFAYPLFLLACLRLISLDMATPDLGVALLVFLAAALLTRNRRLGVSPARAAMLGLVLGLAYLAKAAMLPIGAVFLAVSCLAAGNRRKLALHLAVCGTVWSGIAGSYIVAMSVKSGRPTLGDARALNCLWFVNRVEQFRWRTADPGLGVPVHPPRQLLDNPPVFEFAQPVFGTYPLWLDPGYWCEGLVCRWTIGEQAATFRTTGAELLWILAVPFGVGTAALLLLGLLAEPSLWGRGGALRRLVTQQYHLILPSLAAVGLYLLVHVQGRYLAPFLLLLSVAMLADLRFRSNAHGVRDRRIPLLLLVVWAPVIVMIPDVGVRALREASRGEGPNAHAHWAVAEELARHGVGPGSQVAVLGDAFECGWARLGRLRIVAQVEDASGYVAANADARQAVQEAFRQAGAEAVIAAGDLDLGEGWVEIPDTAFRVCLPR
jgi:hypothetical protein